MRIIVAVSSILLTDLNLAHTLYFKENIMIATIQNSQAEHSLAANLSTPLKVRELSAQWLKVDDKLVCQWNLVDFPVIINSTFLKT